MFLEKNDTWSNLNTQIIVKLVHVWQRPHCGREILILHSLNNIKLIITMHKHEITTELFDKSGYSGIQTAGVVTEASRQVKFCIIHLFKISHLFTGGILTYLFTESCPLVFTAHRVESWYEIRWTISIVLTSCHWWLM